MAEVFLATHEGAAGFKRPFCLKLIIPELAQDGEFREMFVREAAIAGRLCHSNLVQVFDCVEDGPNLALVMEYIQGGDLRQLLYVLRQRGQTVPTGLTAYIGAQVLNALRYAHENQVIHRDISPHNILISQQGEVKLTDFGVAKAMLTHATRTGELKGKLSYMSPEQATGSAVDHRTDLYSLGLVLFELITMVKFFNARTHGELFKLVEKAKKPKLVDVAPEFARVVERLLEPSSDRRFSNAEEAQLALPPWEIIGAAGPVELGNLVRELSDELASAFTPFSIVGDSGPMDSAIFDGQTEVQPGRPSRQRRDVPIIPGKRNAPTETRKAINPDDVERTPTVEWDAEPDSILRAARENESDPKNGQSAKELSATQVPHPQMWRRLKILIIVLMVIAILTIGMATSMFFWILHLAPGV